MIRAVGAREQLVGPEGGLQPLGVVAGIVIAMPARASFSARLTWRQSLDWVCMSRMPRSLRPTPPEDKSAGGAVAGFERITHPGAFDMQYGHRPVQPDDKSRV